MKKILFAMAAVSMLSACTKEEKKTTNTAGPKENKELMRGEEEFTRRFSPIEGGDKADCSESGSSCKIKFDITEQMYAEMSVLDGFISGGDGNGYFNTSNWQILFPEVGNQPGLLDWTRTIQLCWFLHSLVVVA